VVVWKLDGMRDDLNGDTDEANVIVIEHALDTRSEVAVAFQTAEADLDGHFPEGCDAQKTFCVAMCDELASGNAESRTTFDEP